MRNYKERETQGLRISKGRKVLEKSEWVEKVERVVIQVDYKVLRIIVIEWLTFFLKTF